ncbi:MAG: hypothetical protein AAFX06_32130 [Planctomycetota bacterium]
MATQIQMQTANTLRDLGFNELESKPVPGSPVEFELTDATIEILRGKLISVDASGKAAIRCSKADAS